jgi:hypothetical protein
LLIHRQRKDNTSNNPIFRNSFWPNMYPSVAQDTVDANAFGSLTPTILFTGTDSDSDDVRYQIQVDTASTFDSQSADPARVQVAQNGASATASLATSFTNPVTVGNTIIVAIGNNWGSDGQVTSVTDNKGNTYTHVVGGGDASFVGAEIWVSVGVATGGSSFQVTVNQNSADLGVSIFEYSGIQSLDKYIGTGSIIGTVRESGTTANTTQDNDIIIGFGVLNAGTGQWSLGANYSNLNTNVNATTGIEIALEEKIVARRGGASATFGVLDTNDHAFVAALAFRSTAKTPLISALSGTDAGFTNQINGGDTDPFTTAQQVGYTTQFSLTPATTYYWRVRAEDPNGNGAFSAWSATRTFTVSSGGATLTKTQSAIASIANNLTKTQPALARIAVIATKTQGAIARIANTRTSVQSAISRISNTRTSTQPATARIAKSVTKTQPAVSRISVTSTKTQPAISRIANTFTKTQGAISRISNIVTNTQSATARIIAFGTKTQTATARIANIVTKTQSAVARISQNFTKTQTATSRISVTTVKTQPATARLANIIAKTQSAFARIVKAVTKTQPATARIAVVLTKTQSAVAAIITSGISTKTQPATARIVMAITKTQSAVARIANVRSITQTAVAIISNTFTKTQPAVARLANTRAKTQTCSAYIITSGFTAVQPNADVLLEQRDGILLAGGDGSMTLDSATGSSLYISDNTTNTVILEGK